MSNDAKSHDARTGNAGEEDHSDVMLGRHLKDFCRAMNMSPKEVRERGGIDDRTWTGWASGETAPTTEGWRSLAQGFGCASVAEFMLIFSRFWLDRHANLSRGADGEEVRQVAAPYQVADPDRRLSPTIQEALAPVMNVDIESFFSKRWHAPLSESRRNILSLMSMVEAEISRFISLYSKYRRNSPDD